MTEAEYEPRIVHSMTGLAGELAESLRLPRARTISALREARA